MTCSTISVTVPAPTVRPPSRMAKRKPKTIAIGVCSVTSEGHVVAGHHHLRRPRGSVADSVTSVVLK